MEIIVIIGCWLLMVTIKICNTIERIAKIRALAPLILKEEKEKKLNENTK